VRFSPVAGARRKSFSFRRDGERILLISGSGDALEPDGDW
jgi:hypothetical protein